MKLKALKPKDEIRLADADATADGNVPEGRALEKASDKQEERIGDLQQLLYADKRWALLIVLQGRDAAGKDGTIKRVFRAVNPQGCIVSSFGVPTADELHHDFLWRIHQRIPPRGMIGIFNRSHYEDVLVPRVRKLIPPAMLDQRYAQINDFERMLVENNVIVLKFFLHISRKEQKRRLEDRLGDPHKNWKFRVGDLEDRAHWAGFTEAYRVMLQRCSSKWARWYVVPADDKKVRNYLISRTIADTLDKLDLRFPEAAPEVRGIELK
jgi:PPK2 family polyphosphate:nucleotide phosphotransferase